jgi:hypothetical protein
MNTDQDTLNRKNPKFNYVVAKPWNENSNSLCCYTYGTTVQYGDDDNAEFFKEYVEKETKEKYFVYKIVRSDELERIQKALEWIAGYNSELFTEKTAWEMREKAEKALIFGDKN